VRALREAGCDPGGRSCAVLGAGGAARSIVEALGSAGAQVSVVARRREAAEAAAALAPDGFATTLEHALAVVATVDVVVNATPLGMRGEAPPFDPDVLHTGQFVYDTVYHPAETPLLAAARARGVRYRPHSPVASLLTDGGRVTGVELAGSDSGTAGGQGVLGGGDRVYADTVVLAAGVWSPPLLRTAGVVLPIETELHRVAVLAHPPAAGAPVACIDSTTETYFRPEAAGTMTLVGAFAGQRGADPDAGTGATAEELAPLGQAASRRVPALEDAGIAGGVTGVYDMTPDARPLLGRLPGLDGLIVAAGFSGMGFKIAPAVGEGLAGLIAGAPGGSVDLAPFRPGRLSEGRPIEAPNPYTDD
ncbi:MAG: FAD-dependent oxidoreductase, partial [Streptosporangiaceae bacterium]